MEHAANIWCRRLLGFRRSSQLESDRRGTEKSKKFENGVTYFASYAVLGDEEENNQSCLCFNPLHTTFVHTHTSQGSS
jgi:hypothetical protein